MFSEIGDLSHLRQPFIRATGLGVEYGAGPGAVSALSDVSLQVNEGEFLSLVGPSGCGKSTLLRIVGDLVRPTTGTLTVAGEPSAKLRREGRIGFVFQQANLLPWLTIAQNVRLLADLRSKRHGSPKVDGSKIGELLDVAGLGRFARSMPAQLSGGMQQRAGIARALCLDPDLLLMDEPFGALDEITRDRMGVELLRIWAAHRKTVLFVTHSLSEAVFLSDRIVLMTPRPGRIYKTYQVNLPRPRTLDIRLTDAFAHQVSELNKDLYQITAEAAEAEEH